MLRWLTQLFRQRVEAEAAPTAAAPPSVAAPVATPASTHSDTDAAVAEAPPEERELEMGATLSEAEADSDVTETCSTCGRSVFAGPPGQRFCTYCALRGELFEPSAAASD